MMCLSDGLTENVCGKLGCQTGMIELMVLQYVKLSNYTIIIPDIRMALPDWLLISSKSKILQNKEHFGDTH